MPQLDEASKLLLKAADLIEELGWCQHALSDAKGRLSMSGALMVAHYGVTKKVSDEDHEATIQAAWRKLRRNFYCAVPTWNDVPYRTKEEVVAKLRAVALGG